MQKIFFLLAILFMSCSVSSFAQVTGADSKAIKQTILDYAQGWYEGDATRMKRALNPKLAKCIARTNLQGQSSRSHERVGNETGEKFRAAK